MRPDGRALVAVPWLLPRPPATGYGHPRCYLNHTGDCSAKISKEHYISHAVLRSIRGRLVVHGAPWLPAGVSKQINAKVLVSKILCERHNRCLSPLDDAVGKLFETIAMIYNDFRQGSELKTTSWHLSSGEMLELWGMKVIFGLYHSRIASSNRSPLLNSYLLDPTKLVQALASGHLQDPCGLYVDTARVKQTQTVRPGVLAIPIGTHEPPKIGGVQIGIHGLEFDIIFDPSAVQQKRIKQSDYRPRYLTFRRALRRHTIVLTWPSRVQREPELEVIFPE